jgi:plasmid stability protein
MNLTIRNIPDEIVNEVRTLSRIERRSLNSQMLVILENGLTNNRRNAVSERSAVSKELQVDIWKGLAGRWEDERSTREVIDDIYAHRTMGRDVNL